LYLPRIIREKVESTLREKSVLLLGPRQTGKSSLLRHELQPDKVVNLLDQSTFLTLTRRLSSLRESLTPTDKFIVIDEIQKLPQLMDEIHLMIEEQGRRFLLTGSSARKLRRSYTKLMGGRTRSIYMHPLVSAELGDSFDLTKILSHGTLPSVYLSKNPYAELIDYVGDYLQQEILAEAVTRGVDQYSRFLTQIAARTTQVLNIEKLAADAQVSPSTTRRYLEILQDTMIAEQLECWSGSRKHKAISSTKLVFFDVGVVNALLEIDSYNPLNPNAGWQLEQFIGQELLAYRDYSTRQVKVNFWRSVDRHEVDYVLNDRVAIEVKHTNQVTERDLKGLKAISDNHKWKRKIVISQDTEPRYIDDIEVLPVRVFLKMLWDNQF
jgi:predicted AAA+ superfamily ATPase